MPSKTGGAGLGCPTAGAFARGSRLTARHHPSDAATHRGRHTKASEGAVMGVRTRGLDMKAGFKRDATDKAARAEAEAVVQRWNDQLALGRDMLWSPTIRAALIAGTPWLDVFCPGCGQAGQLISVRSTGTRSPLSERWCLGAPLPTRTIGCQTWLTSRKISPSLQSARSLKAIRGTRGRSRNLDLFRSRMSPAAEPAGGPYLRGMGARRTPCRSAIWLRLFFGSAATDRRRHD
jgi:hypothetical protein